MKGSAAGSCGAFLLPDKLNGAKKELPIKNPRTSNWNED